MAAHQTQHHADQEAAERTFRAEREAALELMTTDENAGLRQFVEALCKRYDIKVFYSSATGGTANFTHRFNSMQEIRAVMSQVQAHEAAAVAFHEIAHQLRGPCPKTPPHFCQISADSRSQCCLRCELNAWKDAMRMSPIWTTPMHAQLVYGLRSYRDSTAAPVDEIRELDALITDGFEREQDRRQTFAAQVARQRRVEQSLVPLDVRNQELDEGIRQQRKAYQAMRSRASAIEAARRKRCACGRRCVVVELKPSVRGLCQNLLGRHASRMAEVSRTTTNWHRNVSTYTRES